MSTTPAPASSGTSPTLILWFQRLSGFLLSTFPNSCLSTFSMTQNSPDSASTFAGTAPPSLLSQFSPLLPHPRIPPPLVTAQGDCMPLLSVLPCLPPLRSLGLVPPKQGRLSLPKPSLASQASSPSFLSFRSTRRRVGPPPHSPLLSGRPSDVPVCPTLPPVYHTHHH